MGKYGQDFMVYIFCFFVDINITGQALNIDAGVVMN